MAGYFDNAREVLKLILQDMSDIDLRVAQIDRGDNFYGARDPSAKVDGNGGFVLSIACRNILPKERYDDYINLFSDASADELLAPFANQLRGEIDRLEKLVLDGWKQGTKTYRQEPDYEKTDIIGYDTDAKPATERRFYHKNVASDADQETIRNMVARYAEEGTRKSGFERSPVYNDNKGSEMLDTLLIKEDIYQKMMAREGRQLQVGA